MFAEILQVLKNAIMITGFVFVMMLVIEYINIQTQGIWRSSISGNKWKQYIFAALLGAIPGCLGAFTAVALFSHKLISFGAIVTAMIATSGDEAFVMLAMFPAEALLLTLIIFVVGILAGYISDKIPLFQKISNKFSESSFPLHDEEKCKCFQKDEIVKSLLKPSIYRVVIIIIVVTLLLGVSTGTLAGNSKNWMKITILLVVTFSLFVVTTVPDHFLKEHLWDHILKVHALRIFLWTFGTLLVIHFLMGYIDLTSLVADNTFLILFMAVLVGVIPESGPHLIFVTLFAAGTIPFSILLASSIAQDGHGMLPLLAESKRGFLSVKFVNVIFALIAGSTGLLIGF